jgi:hypothetical protein
MQLVLGEFGAIIGSRKVLSARAGDRLEAAPDGGEIREVVCPLNHCMPNWIKRRDIVRVLMPWPSNRIHVYGAHMLDCDPRQAPEELLGNISIRVESSLVIVRGIRFGIVEF